MPPEGLQKAMHIVYISLSLYNIYLDTMYIYIIYIYTIYVYLLSFRRLSRATLFWESHLVCIYVCIYIYIYIYIQTYVMCYMYVCIYIYIYTHMYIHIHIGPPSFAVRRWLLRPISPLTLWISEGLIQT